MLTMEEVKALCARLALELEGGEDDGLAEEVSCIVLRTDIFPCGDGPVIDHHIDIEYDFGDCYELREDSPLFQKIVDRCGLSLGQEERETVLFQAP